MTDLTNDNQELMTTNAPINPYDLIPAEILSKVLLNGDLAILDDQEKLVYIHAFCKALGLNPLTKPFDILKDKEGGEKLYARKEATEQLRKINRVSVKNITREFFGDKTIIITVYVCTPDGREDIGTGVVSIAGKVGVELANAIMRGETKAKRRATLSICGLGIPDESDIEAMASTPNRENRYQQSYVEPGLKIDYQPILDAKDESELKTQFENFYMLAKGNKALQAEITRAKDKRKFELLNAEIVSETNLLTTESKDEI